VDGHPIHCFSPRNRFSMPRLLLVGDAAGVDPLFGEGIAPALAYGQVAAAALMEAFTQADFSLRIIAVEFCCLRLALSDGALGHCLGELSPERQPAIHAYALDHGVPGQSIFNQPDPLAERPARIEHTRSAKYLIKTRTGIESNRLWDNAKFYLPMTMAFARQDCGLRPGRSLSLGLCM